MNLTPEQYKTLAEFAGYKLDEHGVVCEQNGTKIIYNWALDRIPYTPDTNDAQAMELLKELVRRITDHRTLWLTLINMTRNGELSNLAICHAVLAIGGEG